MSQINVKEIGTMNEIAKSLTPQNVKQLQTILEIPSAIVGRNETEPSNFLYALKFGGFQFEPAIFSTLCRV